ncbi:hypothetical protein CR163_007740 [Prosthecochloris sp. ZM_2]|nr:hypothetical protein CR163_007740 [Prosthecochloris sp. ZM_2]
MQALVSFWDIGPGIRSALDARDLKEAPTVSIRVLKSYTSLPRCGFFFGINYSQPGDNGMRFKGGS